MSSVKNRVVPLFTVASFIVAGWVGSPLTAGQDPASPFAVNAGSHSKLSATASFKLKPDSQIGLLTVELKIAPNFDIYSVTQPPGGPMRAKIKVEESDQYRIANDFVANEPPHVKFEELFQINVETHKDAVSWTAPIVLADNADPKDVKVNLSIEGQICEINAQGETVNCDPFKDINATATFSGHDAHLVIPEIKPPPVKLEGPQELEPQHLHVAFKGQISKSDKKNPKIVAGDKIKVEFTATPFDGFHVYAWSEKKGDLSYNPTLIAFDLPEGWTASQPQASAPPYSNSEMGYSAHDETVTWSVEISIPPSAVPNQYRINGLLGFQTCTDNNCDPHYGTKFAVLIPVGEAESAKSKFVFLDETTYDNVADIVTHGFAKESQLNNQQSVPAGSGGGSAKAGNSAIPQSLTPEQIEELRSHYDPESKIQYIHYDEMDQYPIGTYKGGKGEKKRKATTFPLAALGMFLGGLILNLMPCVFPVLGLKVLGFVEQAGSDASKIRMHGIVFSLGLVVSMWVLAGIVLMLKLAFGRDVSWGAEQMGNPYFVLGIVVLLFILGLNMAGVFEIGTSFTRLGSRLDGKQGYFSSFLTGILTTLIATPCSGPYIAPAMGYTFSQPPYLAMLLFTIFALGIATPYLILCFFPSLISMLPRPGAWMHTFKVIMAFALFATVAFFMQSFGKQTGVEGLSLLLMALVVLGLAAFLYGNWSPAYIPRMKRVLFGWALPLLIAVAGVGMGYRAAQFENRESGDQFVGNLLWQQWSPGKVEYSLAQGKNIVWTDYTANWCLTCIYNKKRVFGNSEVAEKLEKLGVQLVKVDYTNKDKDIAIDLKRSDQVVIPINIIYPPNYPEEPAILFDGLVSPSDALKVIERMEKIQVQMAAQQKSEQTSVAARD